MSRPSSLASLVVTLAVLAGACAGEPPEVPLGSDGEADAVLIAGRELFGSKCATCHGSTGGGGAGPKLSDGEVVSKYPDIADQVEVITDGRRAMPSFGSRLSEAEIEAVVRYTREVLSQP